MESIRSIKGSIEIDSNKRTRTQEFDAESTHGLLSMMGDWLEDNDLLSEGSAPDVPETMLRGTKKWSRRVGDCSRCRGNVSADMTVEVTVNMDDLRWNSEQRMPGIMPRLQIIDSVITHQCDEETEEDD